MSVIRFYRPMVITPLSNNSPSLLYFTPAKIPGSKKLSNFLNVDKSSFRPKTTSAEILLKKEKNQKYNFFQKSPLPPKYIRYQSAKRKLFFGEETDNEIKTLNLYRPTKPRSICYPIEVKNIPSVTLTSPDSTVNCEIPSINSNYLHHITTNVGKQPTPNMLKLFFELQNHNYPILGRGKYGTIVKTKYKDKDVAVKIITSYIKHMKSILKNEQNGIGLNHENVVSINFITSSIKHRMSVIIMDCFDNARDLQSLLDDNKFDLNIYRLLGFSLSICNALQYLHSKQILHLDVKPKNVLVLPNICKLCDFGSSKRYDQDICVTRFNGTIRYCAPEILKGKCATTASDVYSLAITMWQILHRCPPYGYNIREESLIYQIVKNNLRPRIRSALNMTSSLKSFNKIYTTCWNSNYKYRYSIEMIKHQLMSIRKNI